MESHNAIIDGAMVFVKPLIKEFIEVVIRPKLQLLSDKLKLQDDVLGNKISDVFNDYLEVNYSDKYYVCPLSLRAPIELQRIFVDMILTSESTSFVTLNNNEDSNDTFTNRKRRGVKSTYKVGNEWRQMLNHHHKILIVDNAGMGKSTLLRHVYLQIINQKAAIPVLIEARRLVDVSDMVDYLIDAISRLTTPIDRHILVNFLEEGHFIFLIDGYDEVPKKHKQVITNLLTEFVVKANNNKFIIASRPEEEINAFLSFSRFKIEPLTINDAYSLLKKYDVDNKYSDELITKLNTPGYKDVKTFLGNPLLASLLFITYAYKGDIPTKKHLYYRQIYDALFEKHDLNKPSPVKREKLSKLDIEQFESILRSFAFLSAVNTQVEYEKDQCIDYLQKSSKLSPDVKFKEHLFLVDLLKNVPLLMQDGTLYKWLHKSLLDYFAAKYICYSMSGNRQDFLEHIFRTGMLDKFYNILSLCYEIDPKTLTRTIVKSLVDEYHVHYRKLEGMYGGRIDDKDIISRAEASFYVKMAIKKVNIENIGVSDSINNCEILGQLRSYELNSAYAKGFRKYLDLDKRIATLLEFLQNHHSNIVKCNHGYIVDSSDYNCLFSSMALDTIHYLDNEHDDLMYQTFSFRSFTNVLLAHNPYTISHSNAIDLKMEIEESIREENVINNLIFNTIR